MKNEHQKWIEEYVASNDGNVTYRCYAAAVAMVEAFPELRTARGWAVVKQNTPSGAGWWWSRVEHWWCVDADGNIIDPTVAQFDAVKEYDEYDEEKHGPLPVGKCPNCGGYVYAPRTDLCSDKCEVEYIAYLNNPGW